MNNFSKQFAIIKKIKSIVKGKDVKPVVKSHNQETISNKIANKIQQTAYEHSKTKATKEEHTPPYMIVAEQLVAENNQIFQAAAYTLARMAMNCKKDDEKILEILNKSLDDNAKNKERVDYLSAKISEVKKNKSK